MKRPFVGLALAAVVGAVAPGLPAAAACTLGKYGDLPVTMVGLTPTIPVKVNGVDLRMVADSGAFFSLLTPQAASKAGLRVGPIPDAGPDFIIGMGGTERAGIATARDFTILGVTFHHADFLVAAPQLGGEVDGLLGGNVLSFADVEFDLANGVIRLFKPQGCGADVTLAYWDPSHAASVAIEPVEAPNFKIIARVQVNGHEMHAMFDSGAPRSYITRVAARTVGVTTDAPGVRPGGVAGGIGERQYETWIAPFSTFRIGDEEVRNTTLRIADAEAPGVDMLIGADFLLSHRVYVANSQHRLYFTYNGGPVFNLDRTAGAAAPAASSATGATPAPAIPGAPSDQPADADAFSRRAAASVARGDYAHAIADFTRAAEFEPANGRHLYDRGMAHLRNGEPTLARADFDAALKLNPNDADALMARAELRLSTHDEAGATADLEAAARLAPDDRLAVGNIYAGAGLLEQGVAQYDAWIAAHPRDSRMAEALNGRCWLRALWGQQLDQALADCNGALRLSGGNSAFLDSRGLVFLRRREFDKAIVDYNAALRAQPRQAWSLYGRGIAKMRLGIISAGQADIAAATALSPHLPDMARRYGVTP